MLLPHLVARGLLHLPNVGNNGPRLLLHPPWRPNNPDVHKWESETIMKGFSKIFPENFAAFSKLDWAKEFCQLRRSAATLAVMESRSSTKLLLRSQIWWEMKMSYQTQESLSDYDVRESKSSCCDNEYFLIGSHLSKCWRGNGLHHWDAGSGNIKLIIIFNSLIICNCDHDPRQPNYLAAFIIADILIGISLFCALKVNMLSIKDSSNYAARWTVIFDLWFETWIWLSGP